MAMPGWLFPRFRSAWYGFTLPWTALKTIVAHPGLIIWSLLPVGITLTLYFYVIGAAQAGAQSLMERYFAVWGLSPEGWTAWAVSLLTKLLLILIGALTFSFVATVVASPFNDFLAEASERWAAPPLPPVKPSTFGEKLRLIGIDVAKTVAATVAMLAALLLSWIPVVNIGAFALAFLLVTFQYTSYPQTRRGVGLWSGAWFLWRHLFACAGFGAIVSILFAIPLVSSLALPLAVVGGTLLVARAPGDPASGLKALK
jgi:CysZ protein